MTRSLLNVDDYHRRAKARLPRGLYEFVAAGTEDQYGVEDLRRALETLRFVPPVLVDVSDRLLETELFGVKRGGPLIVAPTGSAGLMWHKGEIALAQACAKVDAPFCVSTDPITPLEEIAAASKARLWMQIYRHHDRSIADQLIERAARVGAEALVITVDMPVLPKREHNARNGLVPLQLRMRTVVDMALHAPWVLNVLCRYLVDEGMPCFVHYPGEYRTPITRLRKPQARVADNVTWDEIAAAGRAGSSSRGSFVLRTHC
jgi:(S)-mandelate dehydrogenase